MLNQSLTYTFHDRIITVYENGKPIIRQPFDSDNGKPFSTEQEALAWLQRYFPHLFT